MENCGVRFFVSIQMVITLLTHVGGESETKQDFSVLYHALRRSFFSFSHFRTLSLSRSLADIISILE